MKKLSLFILVLSGILSMQSFAWNYGCGENIPPDVCGAGGNTSSINIASIYFGAIAVNPDTGYWASSSKYTNRKEAKASVLSRCGQNCKTFIVGDDRCVGVAYSSIDKILESDSAMTLMGIGNDTRIERSNEKALKKCEKAGGKNCKIIVNVCAIEGTTEY